MKTQDTLSSGKSKKQLFNYLISPIFVVGLFFFSNCNSDEDDNLSTDVSIDYSVESNWAMPLSAEKDVDVFYVYPTVFGGVDEMNMDITNDSMRTLVQNPLAKQATVFEDDCNIYAPYYRQMSMVGLSLNEEKRNLYLSIGFGDVKQAFDYYIENFNNGRPFILAGHSQGTMALINLMKDQFDKPELMKNLVAAYLIGYSVTDDDLDQYGWLKIAESADDTGVIITYNSQSESATNSPVLLPNANCVNPLNWQTTSLNADKEMNLGAVFFDNNGEVDSIIPKYTGAWIDENGALITNPSNGDDLDVGPFPQGIYHKYDYSFFYNNLKKNVSIRINSFKKHN